MSETSGHADGEGGEGVEGVVANRGESSALGYCLCVYRESVWAGRCVAKPRALV